MSNREYAPEHVILSLLSRFDIVRCSVSFVVIWTDVGCQFAIPVELPTDSKLVLIMLSCNPFPTQYVLIIWHQSMISSNQRSNWQGRLTGRVAVRKKLSNF